MIPDLAALAIKQARGDLIEAIFLIRALPDHLAALWRIKSNRYRRHGLRQAHLCDVQGRARWSGPWADV